LLLSLLPQLEPALVIIFSVSDVMLNRQHCDDIGDTVLLRKLSCANKEIILAGDERSVVMREVD